MSILSIATSHANIKTIGIAAALFVTTTSPVAAQASPISSTQNLTQSASSACAHTASSDAVNMTQLGVVDTVNMAVAAMKEVDNGSISVKNPVADLALDQTKAYKVTSANGTFTSVTIPLDAGHSMPSNLTIMYNQKGDRIQYNETVVGKNDAGNFHVDSYTNGQLVKAKDLDVAYVSNDQLKKDIDTTATRKATDATQNCVNTALGVSGVLAVLMAAVCVGVCAIPGVATPVCVACIGALATFAGSSVTAVLSCLKP